MYGGDTAIQGDAEGISATASTRHQSIARAWATAGKGQTGWMLPSPREKKASLAIHPILFGASTDARSGRSLPGQPVKGEQTLYVQTMAEQSDVTRWVGCVRHAFPTHVLPEEERNKVFLDLFSSTHRAPSGGGGIFANQESAPKPCAEVIQLEVLLTGVL